jgi:2,3-bisphosphoglycerate-dependent phosphoglycerate mutase
MSHHNLSHKGKLLIARHGESEWNATGQWTGLTDVHLTDKGRHEGELMGLEIKDFHLDFAYVSEQVRTLETLHAMLKTHGQRDLRYERRWGINERDYGEYTGLNKWEVKEKVGEEEFNGIRRNWSHPIPGGETLENVYNRAVPFYLKEVVSRLKQGENVLIVSHGNSIRALMKYIERINDQDISKVEMIFGTILIYEVDEQGRKLHKEVRNIETTLPPA